MTQRTIVSAPTKDARLRNGCSRGCCSNAVLPPDAVDRERRRLSVVHHVDAAHDPVAAQDRQHVVPELTLRLRDVHLESVVEVPEELPAIAVVNEPVERREERDAVRHRIVRDLWVHVPPHTVLPDAERTSPLLFYQPLRLAPRRGLPGRKDALAEIPEPLLSDAPRDPDLAAGREDVQHQSHLPAAPPAVVRAIGHEVCLELTREQRAVPVELPQQLAPKARVRPEEVSNPAIACELVRAPAPRHACADERQVFDGPDESVVFEEFPLFPQQPVQFGGVVWAQTAVENQVL